MSGRSINPTSFRRLWEAFERRCAYCRLEIALPDATRDHFVPRSAGGSSRMRNIVPACQTCNKRKDCKPPRKFLALLFDAKRVDREIERIVRVRVELMPNHAERILTDLARDRNFSRMRRKRTLEKIRIWTDDDPPDYAG